MAVPRAPRIEDDLGLEVAESFFTFLNQFKDASGDVSTPGTSPDPKYYDNVRHMRDQDENTLFVDFTDLQAHDAQLADNVKVNYYRVEPYLKRAVHRLVRNVEPNFAESGKFKEFWISFFNLDTIRRLRDMKTENIGSLAGFSGTVTRTSEVRPELYLGTFRCNQCGTVMAGIEQHFKYTTPLVCKNATCGNKQFFSLVPEESVFCDWQKVKVQENASEIPGGSLPRTMDVILRNSAVEQARAGDRMVFTGCLIVAPDVGALAAPGEKVIMRPAAASGDSQGVGGLKNLGVREMTHKLMFVATSVAATSVKEGMINIRGEEDLSPEQVLAVLGEEHVSELAAMSRDPYIYKKLAKSISPNIFGHESIKQALLLMLFGGVHKQTKEGINLRGDINVAIIGDPSCAKSQMLKYVANFLPRAVYTSGKSSTAAGLTATVVKDPETGEFAIEAGALMLADNGICCIDEFDKMDVKDQVAIHEAMEQQTISIAKAGIQATLNARASILAAANPLGGRYDKSRPLRTNINLPPAILSRFDLLHVMLDETTEAQDVRIAEHILNVHRMQQSAFLDVPYSVEQMQRYIKYARAIKPQLTPQSQRCLVAAYKELRGEDAAPGTASAYRITVRQLEALVRLSEAMARVFCSPSVRPSDVEEAKKLLKASILKIEQSDVELEELLGQPQFNDADLFQQQEQQGEQQQQQQQQQQQGEQQGDAMDAEGPQGEQQQAGQAGQQQAKPPVKVTAKKYEFVKTMLLRRLKEQSDAAALQQEPALQLVELPQQPAEGAPEEQRQAYAAAVAENERRQLAHEEAMQQYRIAAAGGIPQQQLVRWYLESLVERNVLTSHAQAEEEYGLVVKMIARLIKKDAALAVVHTPEQQEGEDAEAYRSRANSERLLALAPNYYPDE